MPLAHLLDAPSHVVVSGDIDVVADVAGSDRWTFPGGEFWWSHAPSGGRLLQLHAQGVPLSSLTLEWPARFEAGTRVLGDQWERSYGDLGWVTADDPRPHPWYVVAVGPDGTAHGAGVRTAPAALCSWQLGRGVIRLRLDVRCGGGPIVLSDRTLDVATIVVETLDPAAGAFTVARRLAERMCLDPLLPSNAVYGANDYYHAYCQSTHKSLVRDSAIIAELSPDPDNRPYSVVDAGWQWSGEAYGAPWHVTNARFPDMARLAAEIRDAGARPGIWFRPMLTTESLPDSWLLRQDRFAIAREFGWMLDPSVPEARDRIAADVRIFVEWGYDLIKHDYSTFDLFGRWGHQMGTRITDAGWSFADRGRTTAEIVRDLYVAIGEAAGDALLIGCNTIGHLAAGTVHLQRVGDDTSGRDWTRTLAMGVNALTFRGVQHDALFAVDADCVGVTPDIPWELNRQWLDLLARSGTPTFVSIDPRSLDRRVRADLRNALDRAARPQPLGEPLDWWHTPTAHRWRFGSDLVTYDWGNRSGA